MRGVFLDMCMNEEREFGKGIRKKFADEIRSKFKERTGAELAELAPVKLCDCTLTIKSEAIE